MSAGTSLSWFVESIKRALEGWRIVLEVPLSNDNFLIRSSVNQDDSSDLSHRLCGVQNKSAKLTAFNPYKRRSRRACTCGACTYVTCPFVVD